MLLLATVVAHASPRNSHCKNMSHVNKFERRPVPCTKLSKLYCKLSPRSRSQTTRPILQGFWLVTVCCPPGESVFVRADSQPPVPVPVNTKGVPASVWNTYLQRGPAHRGACQHCQPIPGFSAGRNITGSTQATTLHLTPAHGATQPAQQRAHKLSTVKDMGQQAIHEWVCIDNACSGTPGSSPVEHVHAGHTSLQDRSWVLIPIVQGL